MLVLTTGNKSELGVGYCTLYGDMVGGLAVISDVPKTLVYRLARYVNSRRALIRRARRSADITQTNIANRMKMTSRPSIRICRLMGA